MILTSAILLYLFPALWMLFRKRWPVRAGLSMIGACVLPFLSLLTTDEPMGPGGGILILAILPFVALALLIILVGTIQALVRQVRARRHISVGL